MVNLERVQEARKLMVEAIMLEKRAPLDAHFKFMLAVESFDIFLQAVPDGPRFHDLVYVTVHAHIAFPTSL
jgi:hypothetical protein